MCQSYAKVIISFLSLLIAFTASFPAEEAPPLVRSGIEEIRNSAGPVPNDTVTAKYENTTIIFGHQHVLFSAPTRAPNRRAPAPAPPPAETVENLVAPPHPSNRQSKGTEPQIRIDYTSSEEQDLFEEYSYEVVEDEKRR